MFANFIISLLSVIGGGIRSAFTLFGNFLKSGSQQMIKFHKEGISYARSMGMSLKEAQAYTNTLIERTEVLAQKYGVTAEQIAAVQRNLSEATGRQLMLNNQEAEWAVQINKLVGEQTAKAFTAEIMNHMGGQLSTAQGAVSKAYATAAKRGLDAANFSAKVAQNLSLANKLSFRNGVDGITRMTALSEKLGFNLQSIASAADKFLELDASIENAAQLQMLGGSAAVYGGNPLTMAYEANYDPEAFTERMTNMLKGYATFNRNTGMGEVNGMNRDFVKNIANAMGIGMEEAMTIAKKQAELGYKEGAVGGKLWNLSESQRDFIMNKSYVDAKTGHVMVNGENGPIDVSKDGITRELVAKMQQFDRMSEKDLMETQASKLTDINEKMEGIGERISAIFAKPLQPLLNDVIMPNIDKLGNLLAKISKPLAKLLGFGIEKLVGFANSALPKIESWIDKNGDNIGKYAINAYEKFKKMADDMSAVLGGIRDVGRFIKTYWKEFLFGLGIFFIGRFMGKLGGLLGRFRSSPAKGVSSTTPKGGAPSGGAKPTPPPTTPNANPAKPNTVKYGRHQWHKDGSGNWVNENGKRATRKQVTEINRNAEQQRRNLARNQSSTANNGSQTSPSTNTSVAKPKGSSIIKGGRPGLKAGALKGLKIGTPFAVALGAVEHYMISGQYDEAKKAIVNDNTLSNEEKKQALTEINKEESRAYGASWGSTIGNVGGSVLGGAAVGLVTGGAGTGIGAIAGGIGLGLAGGKLGEAIGGLFGSSVDDDDLKELIEKYGKENHTQGGIVGGSSTQGDKIITGLNSGEMVLNKEHQLSLFNFINGLPSLLSKVGATNNVTYYSAASNNSALANVQGNRTFNTNDQATNTIVNTMNSTLSRLWASNDTSSYSTIADNAVSTRNYLSSIDNSLKSINNSTATSNFVNRAITSNPSTNANYFSSNAVNSYATNNSSNANYNTSTVSNSSSSVVGNSVRRVANNSVNDNVTYYVANNPSNTSNLFTRVNGDTTLFNSTYNASTLANRVLSSLQNTVNNGYSTNNTLTNANTTSNTSNVFTRVVNDILSMFLGNVTNNGVTSNGGTSIRNVAVSNEYSDVARVLNSSLSSVDNGISVLTKYSNLSNNTVNTNSFASTLTSILSTLYGGNTNNVNSATIGVSNYGGMSSSSTLNNETVGGITNSPTFVNALSSVLSNFTNSTSNIRNNSLASVLNSVLSNVYGGNSNVSNNLLNNVNGGNVIAAESVNNAERNYTVSQSYSSNESNGSYVTSNVSTNSNIANGITNILSDLGSVTSNIANASTSVSESISNLFTNSNVSTNVNGSNRNTFASVLNNVLSTLYGGNVSIANGQDNTFNAGNNIFGSLVNSTNTNSNSNVFTNILSSALSSLYKNTTNVNTSKQNAVNVLNSVLSSLHGGDTNVKNNALSTVNGWENNSYGVFNTKGNEMAKTLISNRNVIENGSKNGGVLVIDGIQGGPTSNVTSSNILNTALSTLYNSSSNVITNALNTKNDVVTKPVGEKEYIYIPKSNGSSSNETTVEVKDININLNGTIRLEGGRNSRDVDANMLLNDIMFISSLKDLIKEAINNDMHGGRFMNDLATRRGSSQSSTLFGS